MIHDRDDRALARRPAREVAFPRDGRPAVAETEGPERALRLVDRLDLGGLQYLHSTRPELLRRLGRTDEARAAYERALELAQADSERRFLARRLAELP